MVLSIFGKMNAVGGSGGGGALVQMLHDAQQVALGVLQQEFGLAVFYGSVAIPLCCQWCEKRPFGLGHAGMKGRDLRDFDLQIDATVKGRGQVGGLPRLV